MSALDLPRQPHIDHLRNQARTLHRRVRAGDAAALAEVRQLHPHPDRSAGFTRADALLVVARRYGFASWPRLRAYLETVNRYAREPHREPGGGADAADPAARLLRLACLRYGGDSPSRREQAARLLAERPELATASIHTMAAVGDAAAVAAALAADPALARAEGGPHRWEPLLYATYSRLEPPAGSASTLEVVRLLLSHGADPDAGYLWEGTYPFTALTGALGGGEEGQPPHPQWQELARLLLEAGADPNDSQALYNRGLGSGPGAGGIGHLRLLLAYGLGRGTGGPWHARLAPHHPTPAQLLQDELLRAAKHGHREVARLMLDHGVEVDGHGTGHPAFGGHTAYELAVVTGHQEIAELLAAAGATVPELDPVQQLIVAGIRGDRAAIAELLAADPGLADSAVAREPYLVGRAAEQGRVEAVRLLASLGFDVNLGDAVVIRDGRAPVVTGFLSDVEPEAQVIRRTAPLHLAAWRGDLAMVRALLDLGADPTVRDCEHDATPLGWAEYAQHREVASYLAGRSA